MTGSYQDWVQQNQGTECAVCYGRGYVFQEDARGMPSVQVTCPYCHGWGHQGWVAQRRDQWFALWRRRRNVVILAGIALWASGNAWPSYDYSSTGASLLVLHIALWVAWLVALVICLAHRRPKEENLAPGQAPRHAPGFLDDREKNALGLFVTGLGLRSMFGRRK